jgi:molecular chaperone HscB
MDPFATLGLPRRYDLNLEELEARYRELQRALHPDKHVGASASTRRLSAQKTAIVNDAYRVLKDDMRRAEALLAAHGGREVQADQAADPEFLMQMLELREQLGEARDAEDRARVKTLTAEVTGMESAARTALRAAFDALDRAPDPAQLAKAADLVSRLKYFRRFIDEVRHHAEEHAV